MDKLQGFKTLTTKVVTFEFWLLDFFNWYQNYTQGFPKNKSYQFGILDEKSLQLSDMHRMYTQKPEE
ncbi:hypothetical protein [Nostoc sp.]|uniref:hypothetical protein n=1 Tax=Nostoc sp. TaxID=1180 RepID=UPI002FF679E5